MKTEKKRTLKGSVLFTVVSVLALMIIFMTSALALASAANRRAHKSYSASQASYTARAAIDSILAAVGTDNEFANAVAGITEGGSISVDVGISDPSLGKISNAKVSYDGKVNIFDPKEMKWVEKNRLLITAEVTLGGETQTISSHVIQDPVVKSDDGPGYLTMGGKSPNGNGGTVLGGSYIGMGIGRRVDPNDASKGNLSWGDGITYFKYKPGDPAPVTLEDHQYWTDITFVPKDQNKQEAPVVINGNYQIMTEMALYYTQKAKGAVIWGDVYFPNNGRFYSVFTDEFKSVANSGLKFTEIPYLYVDGDFQLSSASDCRIGSHDGSIPYNLFAGTMNTKQNSNALINANVYLMDAGKTSTLQMGSTNFNSWVGSVYTGSDAYNKTSGFYSLGSIHFSGNGPVNLSGGIRVEENLTIDGEMSINGTVAVGGELKINTNKLELKTGNTMYARNVTGTNVTVNNAGGVKAGYRQGNINYVLAKNVDYPASDGTTAHSDYAWVFPEFADTHTGTPVAGGNAIDFGGANISGYYDEHLFEDLPADDGDTNREKVYKTNVYIRESDGKEVPASEAVDSAKSWTYSGEKGTITIKPIEEFYLTYGEAIYPEYARREVLMGVSGPVKGTEGHIKKGTPPPDVNNKVYNSASLVGDVDQSCTLTGTWGRTVKVTTKGEDIHVLLKDVAFENSENPGEARIYVDESAGGHVYFYFQGSVTSKYSNPSEVEQTKLFDTVTDLMTKWGIEDNIDQPSPPLTDTQTLVIGQNGQANKTKGDGFEVNGNSISITGSTKIQCQGEWNYLEGKTVDIYPPATGTLWVHLDAVKARNNCKFIIHDLDENGKQKGGTVNFYVTGTNDLDNTPIVTESFDKAAKSGKDYQIVSDPSNSTLYSNKVPKENTIPAPRVNLYSDTTGTATIKAQNKFFITAYVRAPYMTCDVSNFGGEYDDFMRTHLYYDGIKLGDMKTSGWKDGGKNCERLGIVGCFNVYDYPSQNDWTLLYVKQTADGGNVVTAANGAHTYASVDYLDY